MSGLKNRRSLDVGSSDSSSYDSSSSSSDSSSSFSDDDYDNIIINPIRILHKGVDGM